jgi:hypothetical protein
MALPSITVKKAHVPATLPFLCMAAFTASYTFDEDSKDTISLFEHD